MFRPGQRALANLPFCEVLFQETTRPGDSWFVDSASVALPTRSWCFQRRLCLQRLSWKILAETQGPMGTQPASLMPLF